MNGSESTKKKSRKRKRLVPLYSRKEVRFPKGLRDFVWGVDDLAIFEPDGKFNANLALRSIIRKYKYSNKYVAERLGVNPVQICRWVNYKNRIQKSWTLMIYNEFFTELDLILNGGLKRSFRKDPEKVWKVQCEDDVFDRLKLRFGRKLSKVLTKDEEES